MKPLEEGQMWYETVFIAKTEEDAGALEKHAFGCGAAEITLRAPLRTQLAFPIKKTDAGFFGVLEFVMKKEALAPFRESLALNPGILRFLIVKVLRDREDNRRLLRRPPAAGLAKSGRNEREAEPQPVASAEGERAAHPHPARSQHAELSNEALEKKLEEMLQ